MGSAAANIHRDIYKTVRTALSDRVMTVRAAAAYCLSCLAPHAAFITGAEMENVAAMCFRAFEGANYETRKAIAKCLGSMLARTQQVNSNSREGMMIQYKGKGGGGGAQQQRLPLEDVLAILMQGFLRGGSGSGLIKGGSPVTQDVRVGVTHCYVAMIEHLGTSWLEKHLTPILVHVLELVSQPKAAASHVDAVYSRRCVGYVIQMILGKMLGEKAQLQACKDLVNIVDRLMNTLELHPENAKDVGGGGGNQETMYSQHLLVVALQELGTSRLLVMVRKSDSRRHFILQAPSSSDWERRPVRC